MKSIKMQLLVGCLFLMLGILISIQVKSIQKETAINNRQKDLNELNMLLANEKSRIESLENLLDEYESEILDFEKRFAVGNFTLLQKQQLDRARVLAGITDITGPGITIKLDDSKVRLTENIDPRDTVIHDYQLLEITNLLKARGAQAISINDERIVTTSETQCAGPTVSVNGVRYSVPFVIKAIGNADYLEASLKETGSILNIMSIYGIQINIQKEKQISIPKYKQYHKNVSIISEIGGTE